MKKNSPPINRRHQQTFAERCYKILAMVPAGKVTTYKAIAEALRSKAFRAVGTAMKRNKNAPLVPCHRVVPSNGTLGEYAFGSKKKKQLLESEGILFDGDKIVDFNKLLYRF